MSETCIQRFIRIYWTWRDRRPASGSLPGARPPNFPGLVMTAVVTGVVLTPVVRARSTTMISSGLVLRNVAIVDVQTGKVTPKMAIVIDGDRITKIAATGTVSTSGMAKSIDATGKFAVPGYWEMHAHPFNNPNLDSNLELMLANGITGIRQMAGSPELLTKRKQGALITTRDSPELLALPGSILLRSNAGTPQAAILEVQHQRAEGADFIKTIDLSPEAFFAALAEATRQNLFYEGHLSTGVSAARASKEGMRAIEHLGSNEKMLIDCSTDEAAVRTAIAQLTPPPSPAAPSAGAALANQRIALADPILSVSVADPTFLPRVRHLLDTYSEEKCRKLAQVFVAHQTWQVPTLIRLRTSDYANDPIYATAETLRYASPQTRQVWEAVAQRYSTALSPDAQDTLHRLYSLQSKIVKMFDEAGVGMLAGSDFGGSAWEVAGYSLHQEFDLLAQAGLSPLEVLQMTTVNGAKFYDRQATDGSVAEGQRANVVLLDGNPIDSVQNLHQINAVVRAGNYYSKEALDSLKQKAAATFAAERPE